MVPGRTTIGILDPNIPIVVQLDPNIPIVVLPGTGTSPLFVTIWSIKKGAWKYFFLRVYTINYLRLTSLGWEKLSDWNQQVQQSNTLYLSKAKSTCPFISNNKNMCWSSIRPFVCQAYLFVFLVHLFVLFVCLFVCLSVYTITDEQIIQCSPNLAQTLL